MKTNVRRIVLLLACCLFLLPMSNASAEGLFGYAQPLQIPLAGRMSAPQSQAADGHYTIGSASVQEKEAWKYINNDRQKQELFALPLDEELSGLARMKSQDMLANRYFAHTSPTFGSAANMLKSNGYSFLAVGENIARYSSIAKAHAGLMSSAGHRKNILGANWTRVGVGVAVDASGNVYVTQLFAR